MGCCAAHLEHIERERNERTIGREAESEELQARAGKGRELRDVPGGVQALRRLCAVRIAGECGWRDSPLAASRASSRTACGRGTCFGRLWFPWSTWLIGLRWETCGSLLSNRRYELKQRRSFLVRSLSSPFDLSEFGFSMANPLPPQRWRRSKGKLRGARAFDLTHRTAPSMQAAFMRHSFTDSFMIH